VLDDRRVDVGDPVELEGLFPFLVGRADGGQDRRELLPTG